MSEAIETIQNNANAIADAHQLKISVIAAAEGREPTSRDYMLEVGNLLAAAATMACRAFPGNDRKARQEFARYLKSNLRVTRSGL